MSVLPRKIHHSPLYPRPIQKLHVLEPLKRATSIPVKPKVGSVAPSRHDKRVGQQTQIISGHGSSAIHLPHLLFHTAFYTLL